MPDRIVIRGGRPLSGRLSISGAKNAALPLLCASLLTEEPVRVQRVPKLADVDTLLTLIAPVSYTHLTLPTILRV